MTDRYAGIEREPEYTTQNLYNEIGDQSPVNNNNFMLVQNTSRSPMIHTYENARPTKPIERQIVLTRRKFAAGILIAVLSVLTISILTAYVMVYIYSEGQPKIMEQNIKTNSDLIEVVKEEINFLHKIVEILNKMTYENTEKLQVTYNLTQAIKQEISTLKSIVSRSSNTNTKTDVHVAETASSHQAPVNGQSPAWRNTYIYYRLFPLVVGYRIIGCTY